MNNLKSKTNLELIDLFNKEVNCTSWASVKGEHLKSLRNEFKNRNIDFSLVANISGGFNLNKKITLKNFTVIFD